MVTRTIRLTGQLLGMMLFLALAQIASAQSLQLTPEQQRMLNALSPAQRAQAEAAIRQIQSGAQNNALQPLTEEPDEAAVSADVVQLIAAAGDDKLRAGSGSRLVLQFSPRDGLAEDARRRMQQDPILLELTGSHIFVLDDLGTLSLPGLDEIPLLGLAEEDIVSRLGAEPYLSVFSVSARLLETEPVGIEALQPFGYDLFAPGDRSFEPASTGPVPPDYVLGPGDSVRVQLFGNVNGIYEFDVTRDGVLNLPEIGPVTVAGIPFSEFRKDLHNRVQQMLIGTQVSVSMGPLKTIRVFVLGDVNRPGSYVVGGLATMSSALYESGGISEVGTLRGIQLKRNGKVVKTFDLYDLLLKGDNSNDARLQSGDVIFVPPVGPTIGVAGSVKRPAIYEFRGKASASDVIALAGGFTSESFPGGATIQRIDASGERRIIGVDLGSDVGRGMPIRTGDVLIVPEVLPEFERAVTLNGHVYRPGRYEWRPGLRLTDVLQTPADLKPGVDIHYVLIRREPKRGGPIEVTSADLSVALDDPSGPANLVLLQNDAIQVFSREFGRQRVVSQMLDELRLQATHDRPYQAVAVSGNVRAPGAYPLEPGMRISDLIRAGGDLAEQAYTLKAEVSRYTVSNRDARQTEIFEVDLLRILNGDANADITLQPHDHLSVSRVTDWESAWTVEVEGEVRFPGTYRIRRGETLRSLLDRVGGLTGEASPQGAVFLRESLKEQEREQIEILARRMEADLTTLSLQTLDATGSHALSTGRVLLQQLRETEPVGRLVIDVEKILASGEDPAEGVTLRDGDRLLIPQKTQVVSVIGETQQNASHLYRAGMSRDDYIELSGGLTRRADKKLIYIVRASGAVVAQSRSRWLGRGGRPEIHPGDTIVVPLDTDKMRPLTFWTNVTQILYQGAIAIAAVRTFDN